MAHLKRNTRFGLGPAAYTITAIFAVGAAGPAWAKTIQLEDGRILSGELGETAGVAEDPLSPSTQAGEIRTEPILVVEDGLRRTFVHKTAVRAVLDERDQPWVEVRVQQVEARRAASLGVIGQVVRATPFDKHGRRIVELPSDKGLISVVQGVTRVTPIYTQVMGLRADPQSFQWDMRLATSSLPRDTLSAILHQATPAGDFDARMQIVRLYLQAERYRDAAAELESVRADFADRPEVDAEDIDQNLRRLRELAARRLLDEIELRRSAGQHRLVRGLLERFPADGVAGDTLQRVRELLDEDDAAAAERAELLAALERMATGLEEPAAARVAERLVEEIRQRLSPATASRLASFRQLARGDSLTPEALAAVALSGWLLGSDNAVDSLPTALSLYSVRDAVVRYLTEPDPAVRDSILIELRESQAADVPTVAEILARIAPPEPLTPAEGAETGAGDEPAAAQPPPGCHEIVAQTGDREVRGVVQLPPEYDPLSRYPTIVTLGEIGAPLERQLDFWAGSPRGDAGRIGQAMRHGYVTLAIDWATPGQLAYAYTAQEHAAVLASLRAAMRRVAIDPDRVFLTGHGAGGDAAWDIALAHPDVWAGCVPMLAVADRYCPWYWKNAGYVPWRIVLGELDAGKTERNARELDRYLRPRFDATVVEYRGRGYESLSDDILRAFDWMGRKRRGPPPEEFECFTMRPWDNFFWWIEAADLPAQSMVAPAEWPRRGARAASVRGRKFATGKLGVYTAAERVTVWLSPELVDFDKPLDIEHNGRRISPRNEPVEPDLRVLLEDARTRADRVRPYWAKVESF
ncbi:peptidase [Botrimarina sp.]|uniref:carboxylesterase family protein n=1 Tax=Botrimarina sp. TaxID=2795802 RepID=UPI0032EF85CC